MISISVQIKGLDVVKAKLRGLSSGKVSVATVSALNSAAYVGSEATKAEMRRVFDRPTPWVLGGVRYVKARRDKLEARIDFDHWGNKQLVTVEKVLAAEILGGVRKHKRHEVALQRSGILPTGMAIVPGPGAALDAYGNLKGGQIVQIMAWFRAFGEQGYKANSTEKTRAKLGRDKRNGTKGFAYFALTKPHGKLRPGIYQRFQFAAGSAVKAIMYFVPTPSYKKRFDFYGVADRAARTEFNRAFPMYLDQLLREAGL